MMNRVTENVEVEDIVKASLDVVRITASCAKGQTVSQCGKCQMLLGILLALVSRCLKGWEDTYRY